MATPNSASPPAGTAQPASPRAVRSNRTRRLFRSIKSSQLYTSPKCSRLTILHILGDLATCPTVIRLGQSERTDKVSAFYAKSMKTVKFCLLAVCTFTKANLSARWIRSSRASRALSDKFGYGHPKKGAVARAQAGRIQNKISALNSHRSSGCRPSRLNFR